MIKDLILKNRSYRRFFEKKKISKEDLLAWIDLARLSPSGANLQSLKFAYSNSEKTNSIIFECLLWASYLKEWDGPEKGERPSAYIIVLGKKDPVKPYEYDVAIACQSILLGAVEKGYGGCIIGSVKRDLLSKGLQIPEDYKITLILALGKPKEKVQITEVKGNNVKYWRNEQGVHHVPKRKLEDILIELD